MQYNVIHVVILAAGKGTRMKSELAKVLHEVNFMPMIHHVLDAVAPLASTRTVVVTGHQAAAVEAACTGYDVSFVRQHEQLGTGHAVLATEEELSSLPGTVMILCGDTPLLRPSTLLDMLHFHYESGCKLTVMSTVVEDPTHYGRVIENEDGSFVAIVEEKDATAEQRAIRKINAGIYCVENPYLFDLLHQIGTDNKQGEVYLTDIVALAHRDGECIACFDCPSSEETLGVNSRLELARAHSCLQDRLKLQLMADGVGMLQPDTITLSPRVRIGRDSILSPGVCLTGDTVIGEQCRIGAHTVVEGAVLGDHVSLGPGCFLQGVSLPSHSVIPAHSCLYPRKRDS